jgi:hypothetical protein
MSSSLVVSKLSWQRKGAVFGNGHTYQSCVLNEIIYFIRYPQQVVILSGICLFWMLVEHLMALARADKILKKDIPRISVSAVGMFEGWLAEIQRIGPISEDDIFCTSTGLTCVMWVGFSFLNLGLTICIGHFK